MWIWRRRNKSANPHYARLIRPYLQKNREIEDELRYPTVIGFMVGIVTNCCVVQGIGSGFYSEGFYFTCMGASILFLPVFMGLYTSWITAQDCSRPEYELLALTTIRDKDLVWGYLGAALERFKILIGFQLGFLLFFVATTIFFILTTALFYEFPTQQNPPRAEFTQAFLLTGLALTLGFIGLYWLCSLMGVTVALGVRSLAGSIFITTIIALMLVVSWMTITDEFLRPFAVVERGTSLNPWVIIVTVIPYGLCVLCFILALHFTRHPLID